MLNRVLSRGTVASLAVTVVPMGALAATVSPATGSYGSNNNKSHRSIQFDVAKTGSGRQIKDFTIYCNKNGKFGAVVDTHTMTVAKSGKFSYKGKALRVYYGAPYGTATLTVNARFVSKTKAKGTAKFTAKPKLAGCPAPTFTATKLP